VDTPPTELNPEAYAKRIRELLKGLPRVKIREIEGAKLLSEKLVGIHSVGRAAVNAPRMVIAQYSPARGDAAGKRRHFALVGKGVTFDTGGLNLKISGSMRSMKCDMGGSAAVLGAFRVLVQGGFEHDLTLIMCLAENAIDANSYKPDDILTVHSGKTVEINNTDAEGRLLLIDGVSYAARVLGADTIIDAATLTGAQMIATGQMHAVIVSNDGAAEAELVAAGTTSGDLCHPLPFAPEFYKSEFESVVADMCNSVHNRMNAQTACAAQFVYWHLEGTDVRWCHIDLAGPAFRKNRGTGYGVALISQGVRNLAALDATEQAAD
ncbi:MAG: leucyl aminopeptidase family protein, partial [Myxococcales bacterium]|nr:leucyl aminopeptidase family protein [Myxococcales bacterium]